MDKSWVWLPRYGFYMLLLLIPLLTTEFLMIELSNVFSFIGLALRMSKEQHILFMGQQRGWVILQRCFVHVSSAEICATNQ